MNKKLSFIVWSVFFGLIIGFISCYFAYKKGLNKGFEEGKEWTIQTILDYDRAPITCDEDCEVS